MPKREKRLGALLYCGFQEGKQKLPMQRSIARVDPASPSFPVLPKLVPEELVHVYDPRNNPPPTQAIEHEPWVDLRTLAEHIGFRYQATRRMVEDGKIPGKVFQNGRKTFWRFQLSAVDAALTVSPRER